VNAADVVGTTFQRLAAILGDVDGRIVPVPRQFLETVRN
jgi:hypothetical protein